MSNGKKGARAAFSSVDMSNVNLSGANLPTVDLSYCVIKGAGMQKFEFLMADLPFTDLRGADMGRTDLHGVKLKRANLRNANLVGAVFSEVNV